MSMKQKISKLCVTALTGLLVTFQLQCTSITCKPLNIYQFASSILSLDMKGFIGIQEKTIILIDVGKVNIFLRLLRAAYDVKRTNFRPRIVGGKI